MTNDEILEIGYQMLLSNTYHIYIRPGMDIIREAGGLHSFMNMDIPILTDSGGFQVFSLSDLCSIEEEGVRFRSHLDGSLHDFTPRKVLDIQRIIGSDVMMVLDQCTEYPITREKSRQALERTVRWAAESITCFREEFDSSKQTIFAIVQGSVYPDQRRECARRLVDLDFPGYAIGGLCVGEPVDLYREMTSVTCQELPPGKPRYMMGVGSPLEILHAVEEGIDMFDCVMPTRIARNGTLYTSQGRINIKSAPFARDWQPLDPECRCRVCRSFSRAYLRHIFRMGEISSLVYNTYHNLFFMKRFMEGTARAIEEDRFRDWREHWQKIYGDGKDV
jgi:queuine tRNA-ribosyltransferase